MASTIKVDKIEGSTGSTITVPTGQTFTVTDGMAVAGGGTGLTSFTAGDVLYATGSTTLAKLAKGTAEQVLAMNSGATAPDWGSVDLTVLPTITVAKGGTNLSSFTAGDILYATGATTLAKLAKGSGSDTLKMNSGATAPEWVTVAAASSDFVNLTSGSAVNAASLSLDGFYTTDYHAYKLYCLGLSVDTASAENLFVRIREADADKTDGNYTSSVGYAYRSSGSGSFSLATSSWNHTTTQISGETISNAYVGQLEMTIFDPLSVKDKQVNFSFNNQRADGVTWQRNIGGMQYATTTASSGISLYMTSSDITIDHYALYGLKAT